MEINKIYLGDSLELIKQLPDNFIDLVITSPPYSDVKSYGQDVSVLHPDHFAEWLLQYNNEVFRVLKTTGSFILNINDKIINKQRHIYVMDYTVRSVKETQLKLYDTYIWHKQSCLPNSSEKRLNNDIEYIFHFVKDPEKVKWNMDDVREPYTESSLNRIKSQLKTYETDETGKKISKGSKMCTLNPAGRVPSVVFRFQNNQVSRGNAHPAPFAVELVSWFIKALTDKDDTVLDIFLGSGTTAEAALLLGRKFIGFEINENYIKMAQDRISHLLLRDKYF